jgi:hypothetical protein
MHRAHLRVSLENAFDEEPSNLKNWFVSRPCAESRSAFFPMSVPNIEDANNGISPLIVSSAGDSRPLIVAMKMGQERERARILKGIHDEISPQLLSAVFLAQIIKENLEEKELEESDMAARLSEVLVKVIDGLVEVLDPPLQPRVDSSGIC